MYYAALLYSLIVLVIFLDTFGFSIDNIMTVLVFQYIREFFFPCLIRLVRLSNTMMNRSGEKKVFFLVPDLREKSL